MSKKDVKSYRKSIYYTRYTLVFLILIIGIIFLTVWNIYSGPVNIPVREILRVLFTGRGSEEVYNIIWKIRMPRIITSAMLGGALALSGFLLQTFFGNPIAGPFVLGISSGSKLFVAIIMIFMLNIVPSISSLMMVGAAFLGAMISMGFVLLVSRVIKQMSMLLVAGIMISYICSAITEFIITFARDTDVANLHNWSQGSFSGMNWNDVILSSVIVGVTVILVFMMSKPIGAFQMGEAYAQSMGVDVKKFRLVLILLSSLLSGCVTAFAGPISFVGIAVPHIIRILLKTSKPILVIPASFLGGAVFCMFCDYIARTAFNPIELSISTVTALFGAPVVIGMMLKKNNI
jgi:iron complex transport system permease protein